MNESLDIITSEYAALKEIVVMISVIVVGLSVGGALICMLERVQKKKKINFRVDAALWTSGVIFLSICFFFANELENRDKLIVQVSQQLLQDSEVKEVGIADLASLEMIDDLYCPQVKSDEDCYDISFIGDTKYKRAFVPIKKDLSGDMNKRLTLSYLDFNDKEKYFMGNYIFKPTGTKRKMNDLSGNEVLDVLYGVSLVNK